jgi:hypothetical protein
MALYVKAILATKRSRIHDGGCRHCRNGQGLQQQPVVRRCRAYWRPSYPQAGYATLAEAQGVLADLGFANAGICADCLREVLTHA